MQMRTRIMSGIVVVLAATQGGATSCGQIIDDQGFDLWCGEQLCRWELEKGAVQRAATWHDADSGVEMVGDDVAISQVTPVESADGHCVRVTMVADVEESAEVRLAVDVYGDGSVESDERIPTSDWRKLTYVLRMPDTYSGVRFRLSKRGSGRAVLANIGAEIVIDEACTSPPISASRPDGAVCVQDSDCESGQCFEWLGGFDDICGGCDEDADCIGLDLCTVGGISPGWLAVASSCMPPGSLDDGRRCLRDANCASGNCIDGRCGECRDATDCGGAACLPAAAPVPARCDRGRAAGATCFRGTDCDSGVCDGEPLLGCNGSLDRECADDGDCPGELTDPENTTCATVGFAGGLCQ
jgi:hypothetical protein